MEAKDGLKPPENEIGDNVSQDSATFSQQLRDGWKELIISVHFGGALAVTLGNSNSGHSGPK